jgi:hypothetical protein
MIFQLFQRTQIANAAVSASVDKATLGFDVTTSEVIDVHELKAENNDHNSLPKSSDPSQ